jgi:hypothetical protein
MTANAPVPIRQRAGMPDLIRLAEDLRAMRAEWVEDDRILTQATARWDLPTLKSVAEKIAIAPPPPTLSGHERMHARDPVNRERALKACIVATASLGGPRSAEETEFYLRDIHDVTIEAGASEAELLMVRRWIITAPGAQGRPDDLPLFRFRPAPAEWDAMLRQARRVIRELIWVIDRRCKIVSACKGWLADWSSVEASAADYRQSVKEWAQQNIENTRAALEASVKRQAAREAFMQQRKIEKAEGDRLRRQRVAEILEEARARMSPEMRDRMDKFSKSRASPIAPRSKA